MSNLSGKRILITGASSGIGAAAMALFAKEGACVIGAARRQAEGQAIAETILQAGGDAHFYSTDLSDEASIETLFKTISDQHGPIDGAMNNASSEQEFLPIHETPIDVYDNLFAINVRSVFLCLQHEIRAMRERGGAIVNIASIAGVRGYPGLSVYTASKHSVIGMTKSAALDAAPFNIRVNALAPGTTRTEMFNRQMATRPGGEEATIAAIPLKRTATPHEQAETALWLLSDQSSFVTGETIICDGGRTIA